MKDLNVYPTYPEFRTWLLEHDPNDVIGIFRDNRDCAIARCVNERSPSPVSIEFGHGPKWADRFIRAFDQVPAFKNGFLGSQETGKFCHPVCYPEPFLKEQGVRENE